MMLRAWWIVPLLALPAQDDRDKLLKTFVDEFVAITPGENGFPSSYSMGGAAGSSVERPPHEVTFKYAFKVARYEVPQNLWEAVMGDNPSAWKGRRNSVEKLSFAHAEMFCRKTTELLRAAKLIGSEDVVRLPSESEWEYVARAGTATRFSFGDNEADLGAHAWFTGNAAGNDPPVGAKKPNAWKLYDVHGYLWEWCADPWHDDYQGAPTDGSVWTAGGNAQRRMIRGGSWKDEAGHLTSSFRRGVPAEFEDDAVGLRCVLAKVEGKK